MWKYFLSISHVFHIILMLKQAQATVQPWTVSKPKTTEILNLQNRANIRECAIYGRAKLYAYIKVLLWQVIFFPAAIVSLQNIICLKIEKMLLNTQIHFFLNCFIHFGWWYTVNSCGEKRDINMYYVLCILYPSLLTFLYFLLKSALWHILLGASQ